MGAHNLANQNLTFIKPIHIYSTRIPKHENTHQHTHVQEYTLIIKYVKQKGITYNIKRVQLYFDIQAVSYYAKMVF